MNMRNWLTEKMNEDKRKALPILSFPSIQLSGITVRDLIAASDVQADGMFKIAQRCPTAASVSMMDLSVEAEAFAGIAAQVVSIPDQVTALGSRAFANCASLRQIFIPASVMSFGTDIFDGCSENLLIYGAAGSEAEAYADANGLIFVPLN